MTATKNFWLGSGARLDFAIYRAGRVARANRSGSYGRIPLCRSGARTIGRLGNDSLSDLPRQKIATRKSKGYRG